MKLPNFMCRVIGHNDFSLSYPLTWQVGAVTVCRRCGRGFTSIGDGDDKRYGWFVKDALQRLLEEVK